MPPRKRKKPVVELSPVPVRQRRKGLPPESRRTTRNRKETNKLLAEAKDEVRLAVKMAEAEEPDIGMEDAEVPGEQRQPLHCNFPRPQIAAIC